MTDLTAVICAGAAGIAAARTLMDSGYDVLLIEASDRIGGRAHTVMLRGYPLDLGCGWLHSARRNPWTRIAEMAGLAVDRSSPGWSEQWRDLGYPPAAQRQFGEGWARWETAARAALGPADKAFLHVDGAIPWPAHAHLIGDPLSSMTASYRLSPFGWPLIEAFFGADCAETLEDGDAAAFAIGELVTLLGSDWRARLTTLGVTRWRHEARIGGSYSHARVGCAGQRQVLAEPVDGRLFFAGEACHRTDFSTAHGAYETGVAAAEAIMARTMA